MHRLPRIPAWRRYLRFWQSDVAADVDEKLRFHLETRVEALVATGVARDGAATQALAELGDLQRVRDGLTRIDRRVVRRRSALERWRTVATECQLAVRRLRHNPTFAIAAVLTLALGIGATSALFAIVDRLFLAAPTGLVDPGRLHRLYVKSTMTQDGLPALQAQFGYADYLSLAEGLRSDGEVTAFTPPDSVTLSTSGETQPVRVVYASGNYFSVLGLHTPLGRFFSSEEERMGAPMLSAVLSDGVWQRAFGGRRDVLGGTVTIDDRRFVVVGVAPPGFVGTDLSDADVWLPLPASPVSPTRVGPNRILPWYEASLPLWWPQAPLEVVVRLRSEASASHVAAVGTTVLRRTTRGGGAPRVDSTAVALVGSINQALAPTLSGRTALVQEQLRQSDPSIGITWRLMAVVVLLLIIACLNVANLMLGRGMQRRREIAARIALGASRRHLLAQILSECFVLAMCGGLAALATSIWGSAMLKRLLLPGAHWAGSLMDLRVMLFTGAVAVTTCVVVALIPGLEIGREDVARTLTTGRGAAGQAVALRRALVITQSALSMVLLVGGGVFFESLSRVRGIDVGYDVDRLISGSVVFRDPQVRYDDTWDHTQEIGLGMEQVATDLAREPGIQTAATSLRSPMSARLFSLSLDIPGVDTARLAAAGLTAWPPITPVSPSYFDATGIRLLKGRLFTDADRSGAPTDYFLKEPYRATIVSEAMARTLWPNEDPIGKCFVIGRMPGCVPIVGVVTDAHVMDVVESESMQYYVPLRPNGGNVLTIRVGPGQESHASQLLWQALRTRFPSAETPVVQSLTDVITPQLRPWRLGASLFSGFGVLALIIAFVGLYGLIAYSVTQRTWELGLRLALGAQRESILSLVVREGLSFVAIGIALGAVLSLVSGRAIATLLYDTSPYDPRVLVGVAVLLFVCAAAASLAPGWRASRIDPASALRAEG